MLIVHLSAECFPVAKVGGLADVVGALPKYLNKIEGTESMVIMPFVENKFTRTHSLSVDYSFDMPFGGGHTRVNILKNDDLEFPLFLVQIEGFGIREEVYGYDNDPLYFLAFQIAVLIWIHQWDLQPDIIHCHDQHTGFVPFMMKHAHMFPKFRNTPSIFTIHNGEYQGKYSKDLTQYFPWFDTWQFPLLEWDNELNAMASAIKCAWMVTTVSPQYMSELASEPNSIAMLLRQEYQKTTGILNGIDVEEWNPMKDHFLKYNYNIESVTKGKESNKLDICNHFGFDPALPLVSFIGRFVPQKGADVLSDAIWRYLKEFNGEMNFLMVGSGDPLFAHGLDEMKQFTQSKFNTYIGYNEGMARNVYAATDFLIMPSRFEPSGLNQFYALRYGAVPIVRTVGGLLDSIIDIDDENGNGIRFIHLNTDDIIHALRRAKDLYNNKKKLNKLRKFIMQQDFSWEKSAIKYHALYEKLL
ncbi:glycosyltransferase [Flavobacteriaceae bacterium Ap0902]|nr:glycosyltransferase [Flavobacteriaceae bacterium Ap0902]